MTQLNVRRVDRRQRRSSKDPFQVSLRLGWCRSTSQARFRGELWQLTWAEWQQFWPAEAWAQRGRGAGDLCLTRRDPDLPWNSTNTVRMERVAAVHVARSRAAGNDIPERLWSTAITLEDLEKRNDG